MEQLRVKFGHKGGFGSSAESGSSVKTRVIATLVCLLIAVAASLFWAAWKRDEPRRKSIHALEQLQSSLSTSSPESLATEVLLPPALAERTVSEQTEFIRKALQDEMSPAGIVALKELRCSDRCAMYSPTKRNSGRSKQV